MKLMRYSKRPASLEHCEAYETAFKAGFDALEQQHNGNMTALQEALQKLENDLLALYPTIQDVTMPKSNRAWTKLVKAYGAPIMVAQSSERPLEAVLVVMDDERIF